MGKHTQFMARQGDVLIIAVNKIPTNAKPVARENGRLILAHGEITGHAHVVDAPDAVFLATDLDEMADRFLKIESECQVVHDEHAPINLVPGLYRVRRQREYSPAKIRNVAD